ncbi:MAG: metalloregulator ArsR/SmtB family transcription factor [Candidatus Nanopelagicaceae bacterium]|nr:metalloregulator ArsR/SmtB family transcription factor [Candidatus Nanopelagicaceae bacterium]
MGRREAKQALYEQFARMGKGLANPKRLELLDLLSQGERSVEALSTQAGLGLSTTSMHLQGLKDSGLVVSRRSGTSIYYRMKSEEASTLFAMLREVASTHLADADRAISDYLGSEKSEGSLVVNRSELPGLMQEGEVVVLDVRPTLEYEAGHIPGAVSTPLPELERFLAKIPRDHEVVVYCRGAYCVLAYDAIKTLTLQGRRARRLQDGMLEWRLAGLPVEKSVA